MTKVISEVQVLANIEALAKPVETKSSQTTADGLNEVLSWSADLPSWQKDALRRLCAGPDLQANDDKELLEILRGETMPDPLSDQHIKKKTSTAKPVSLRAIKNVSNVNALAPAQTLGFGEKGMTIIYGENGSGKSGYVRILKSACRARMDKNFSILADIYDGDPHAVPTAEIEYSEGGSNRMSKWEKGKETQPSLSAINVFDTAAANIHVSGTNDIAYTPFPLLVLARLAKAADRLKDTLTLESKQLENQIPPTLNNLTCSPLSATGKLLSSLNEKTKKDDVEKLSSMNDVEQAELAELKKDLADDPAIIATKSLKLAQRLEGLGSVIETLSKELIEQRAEDVIKLKIEIDEVTKAANAEAERRFAGDPLPAGNKTWKALWTAAEAYAKEVFPKQEFPQVEEDGVCVLCQRKNDSESVDRFARFKAFMSDELGKTLTSKNEDLRQAYTLNNLEYLSPKKISEVRAYLEGIGQAALAKEIGKFLVSAAWTFRWIKRSTNSNDSQKCPKTLPSPNANIKNLCDSLREKAAVLQGDATSPARLALKAKFSELSDREWLGIVKEDVLKAIDLKVKIAKIKKMVTETSRTKITTKSTDLAKTLVTDRMRDRFAAETVSLGISRLRVELKQEKSVAGEPKFKVCFVAKPTENVGAVLSEGELRCLAIAAFLAELETEEDSSAIVLDDPISSLDHIHRENTAQRLAVESLKRQVVIFTHDIPFMSQLQSACKKAGSVFNMKQISRGIKPGFCHAEAPTTHRPVENAIAGLTKDLEARKSLSDSGDPKWHEYVTQFGGVARKLWERAVEEVMSPVLTRWTHKVNTTGFLKLTVITPEDHDIMREAFGRCSVLEHYQPSAGNIALPKYEDLKKEVEILAKWYSNIMQKQDAVDKKS